MTNNSTKSPSIRLVLTMLIGQAVFFGAALALIYVVGNTLFLVDYGSEFLPYVYIITGIFAALVFFGLATLQRHWALSRITSVVLVGQAVTYFLARWILMLPNTNWISIVLLVFFPLGIQLLLISLGGQAGRLFDLRQMKRYFPLVTSGITVGFTVASFSVPFLVNLLNGTDNLLLVAGGSMLITLVIFLITLQRFRQQLGQKPSSQASQASQSLGQLLKNSYTANLFNYQTFSALGTQLVIYIFLVQAEAQFTNETELANFFGTFVGARNIVTFFIMLFVAGPLISRFGLGFGLTLNPITVAIMVAVMGIAALFSAPIGIALFWLASLTYVLDNFQSDAITNTSLKTAYQTLPVQDRSVVETTVEGIGVPAALGVTGILLLVLNAIPVVTLTHIIFFAFVVSLVWAAFSLIVYREYTKTLLHNLSRRALGQADLLLDDSSSLAVVQNLLQSQKLNEVSMALSLLDQADPQSLNENLIALAGHPQAEIRAEALSWIAHHQVHAALPVVEQRLTSETDPAALGATLRALCALTEEEALEHMSDEYLDDPETAVRLGAMVGLLRYGGISGVLAAGMPLTFLVDDIEPEQRIFAAQVIGEVGQNGFYQPLITLLEDEDDDVRRAALRAAGQVKHRRLFPLIVDNLGHSKTRAEAMSTLVDSGDVVLPLIGQILGGNESTYDSDTVRRLVRVCGQIKGESVIDLLKQHLNNPNAEIQYQILVSLSLCGFRVDDDIQNDLDETLNTLVEHGSRVLLAKQDIGEAEALEPLHAALTHEFNHIRSRIFLLLSFMYEPKAILRAEERLARGTRSQRALAIESLEVSLSSELKDTILPLVDESMAIRQRVQSLSAYFSLTSLGREQRLREVITDLQRWNQDWTRACAIYAGGKLLLQGLVEAIEGTLHLNDPSVKETADWALPRLAPSKY